MSSRLPLSLSKLLTKQIFLCSWRLEIADLTLGLKQPARSILVALVNSCVFFHLLVFRKLCNLGTFLPSIHTVGELEFPKPTGVETEGF